MKVNDCLFAKLYKNIFFGGSFYDGLRVGKPEEFDLDILLTLPTFAEPTIQINNKPGFVQMQFKCLDKWLKQPEAAGCGLLVFFSIVIFIYLVYFFSFYKETEKTRR